MAGHPPNARQWNNDLQIVLNFYTDDPKRVKSETRSPPNADNSAPQPYWAAVRKFQENDLFLEGMLLRSLERAARHPYIHYIVYNSPSESDTVPGGVLTSNPRQEAGRHSLMDITASRGFYREMYTFVDHQTALLPKRPQGPSSAYIVSSFKAIGSIKELDKSWSYWSGADFIVETIPTSLRLQRLTFHKIRQTITPDVYAYVMMCELGEALTQRNKALEFVDMLNDRQCGLSSLYVVDHFL